MSTRQRSATASRKDAYGLWDSDSDRPRQTMATTQRHNVEQGAPPESSRKHRSSRRTDPLDPAAHSHHKSSTRDRSSTVPQSSQYVATQPPYPSSTSRAHDAYSDAYGLRAYIKKKTDKRSPRSSNEKVPIPDDAPVSRSTHPSRYDYATAATYAQPPASSNYYAVPPDQTVRDPTSSSRHHRERTKDREKSSRRDVEKLSMRDYASERSEDRERARRKEKEAAKEKERSSRDRDRRREKDRSKHRDVPADRRAPDATSLHQAPIQASAPAQRSNERLPVSYPDYTRTPQTQTTQIAPSTTAPTTLPWTGLTAVGRAASIQASAPAVDAGYPSASDREDPPLPIPPPGHRRERSSSKAPRSQRHQVLAQQAAQDSGISSSEQEHSGMERTRVADRRYASREQASTLGRGQSSGPSGSENERAPTVQKERRKHKESSRHRSRTAAPDGPPGPTTSQEIATAWYSRHHHRDASGTKQSAALADSPQRPPATVPHDGMLMQSGMPYTGKPTSHVGLTSSQRPPPQIVSIRAGQGPSEPHAGTLLPKNHSATSVNRLGDPQTTAYEMASRSQPAAQYYQQSAGRPQDTTLQAAPHPSSHPDGSRAHQHSSVNAGAPSSYQQPMQGYPNPPDVVVRPPSTAPTQQDPYSSRTTMAISQQHHGAVPGQHLQASSHDNRGRSTPAPPHATSQSHTNPVNAQQVQYSHPYHSAQQPQADPYRSATTGAAAAQQYGVSELNRILSSIPQASAHAKGASQDPSSRFPVYEDLVGGSAGYGSQQAAATYNTAAQATAARPPASASQGYPSASPKRNLTYPGASAPAPTPSVHVNPSNYHGATTQDARSPKPPSVATITPDTAGTRSHGHGAHGREPSNQSAHHHPSPRHDQSAGQLAGDAQYAHASGQGAGHSPSRHYLADPGRSPAGHVMSMGSAANTPKHSPSGRLHSHRNGSNDTITHAAQTKPSPSGTFTQQQLPNPNSATNPQPHAASRPDNASVSRPPNASSGYPDPARYRSPAPPGYPTQPQSAPNGNSVNYSQSYYTQPQTTSYDQYGRPVAQQSRAAQPADYGHRSQEPPHSAPPTSTTMPISSQRVPPRTAPSPAPTVRPARLTAVSSPTGKAPSLHAAPPQPTRHQTYPAPAPNPPPGPFPSAHSRTVSDPQYPGRAVNSAYPSGSLPSRGQSHSRTMANALQPPDVLLTPSSLAPSMLPPVSSHVPLDRTTSKSSTKEKEKDSKKPGLLSRSLSLFRSRSSPPKPREQEAPPSAAIREKRQRNVSQPTQPLAHMQAAHVPVKPTSGAPAPQVAVATVSIPAPPQPRRENNANQVPVVAPTPIQGRRSPNGKMFTPFRLVAKRHHTVSTASVDAVDGTVINAMLTGGESTRSSTAGRPSPPLRDPMTAAQEWRNREEYEQQVREGRGAARRRRPGVTFDINEEVPEDGRVPVQKSLKANLAAMQAAGVPPPTRQATA